MFKKLFVISLVFVFATLSGCGEIKEVNELNKMFMSDVLNEELAKLPAPDLTPITMEEQWEEMYSVGLKYREFINNPDIHEVVIIVNDMPTERKSIKIHEAMSLLPNIKPSKVALIEHVRGQVALSEAIRLGLEPSQEDLDRYLEGIEMVFEQDTDRESNIFGFIDGRGITKEEYIKEQKENMYSALLRNELKKSLPEGTDYEEYLDKLVAKADIQILDPEIENVLKE